MAEDKAKYTVKNTTILHNKTQYIPGAAIELTGDEAKKLAAYITPVKTTAKNTSESSSASTKTEKSTTKSTKSSKKNTPTEALTSVATKQEDTNDKTVQTPSD